VLAKARGLRFKGKKGNDRAVGGCGRGGGG